ncbi:MAG: hypothetical protein ACF8GE_12395 [Phycisphaerales bacterium JB043]
MTDQNTPDNVYVANPDDFDEIEEFVPKPGWIKPVGVISIIWGAIGLLLSLLGGVWIFVGPSLMQSAAGNMQGGVPDVMLSINLPLAAAVVVGLIWAVFLLISGIMLLVQSPLARTCFLIYALGGVVITLGSTWVNLDYQEQIAQWIEANPDADFSQQAGAQSGGMLGLVLGIVLGLAWPVFCMIWFGVIKNRPEHYTAGSSDIT